MNEQELRRKLISRQLLVPAEAAFLVGRSKRTLNRWIRAGLTSHTDPRDGAVYVRLADVHRWIQDHPTRRRSS